jgi:hypothetical protein
MRGGISCSDQQAHRDARRGTWSSGVRSLRAHPKERRNSRRGGDHAKTDLIGDCCSGCFGSGHDNGRSFASRRHRTAGLARRRRCASSHGNRPSQNLERPTLLLVRHRLAGGRLVRVWLQVAARLGLGWSGRVARVATTRPAPGSSSANSSVEAGNPASASATTPCYEVMTALAAGRRRQARCLRIWRLCPAYRAAYGRF